jgi:cytochrome c-type biogenesis protein CcmH/NrfG
LFNVLGDCLFCQGQFDDAHRAYLDAARVDPNDPRANLSLAHTLARTGEITEALSAISRGLANDTKGHFRPRLLDKQAQILDAMTARTAGDRERMRQRLDRLR